MSSAAASTLVTLTDTPARAVLPGPTTSAMPAGSAPRTTDSPWPVGSRSGVLERQEGTTPTGPPTRQLKAVRVALRADEGVATIKPGTFRKGYFDLKRTRRGPGTITFTAVSRGYRASVTVRVRTS